MAKKKGETNEFAVVGGDNLVGRLKETSVDHTLNAILEQVLLVDWLLGRL
jgi:hypothetical protein